MGGRTISGRQNIPDKVIEARDKGTNEKKQTIKQITVLSCSQHGISLSEAQLARRYSVSSGSLRGLGSVSWQMESQIMTVGMGCMFHMCLFCRSLKQHRPWWFQGETMWISQFSILKQSRNIMRASPKEKEVKKEEEWWFSSHKYRCPNQKTQPSELRSKRRMGWTMALTLVLVLCRWCCHKWNTEQKLLEANQFRGKPHNLDLEEIIWNTYWTSRWREAYGCLFFRVKPRREFWTLDTLNSKHNTVRKVQKIQWT